MVADLTLPEWAAIVARAEEAGFDRELWLRLLKDPAFRARMAIYGINGAFADPHLAKRPYAQYKALRVFGRAEWEAFFEVGLSPEQSEVAQTFTWPDGHERCAFWSGLSCVETHFAFLSLDEAHLRWHPKVPLTSLSLEMVVRRHAMWENRPKLSLPRYACFETPYRSRWHLMSLLPIVANGRNNLPTGYELMTAGDYVLGLVLYYQKYGRWPTIPEAVDRPRLAVCAATAYSTELVAVSFGHPLGSPGHERIAVGIIKQEDADASMDPIWAVERKMPS